MPEQTQDLPELLREIAEEAPEVVMHHQDVFIFLEDGDLCAYSDPDLMQSLDERAIIQAALQAAIEEREWTWDLKSSGIATINRPGVPAAEKWSTGEADDPVTALARAFLKALRAEQ